MSPTGGFLKSLMLSFPRLTPRTPSSQSYTSCFQARLSLDLCSRLELQEEEQSVSAAAENLLPTTLLEFFHWVF